MGVYLSFSASFLAIRDLPDPIYPERNIFIKGCFYICKRPFKLKSDTVNFKNCKSYIEKEMFIKQMQIYINFLLKNKLMIVYLHPHLRNNAAQDLVAQLVEHLPFKERVLG